MKKLFFIGLCLLGLNNLAFAHDIDGDLTHNGDGTLDINLEGDNGHSYSGTATDNADGSYDLDVQNDDSGNDSSGTLTLSN